MKWFPVILSHFIVIASGGMLPDLFSGKRKQLEEQLHEAHAALEEAEKNYRSIVEKSIEGIFRTTPDGHYLSANPALARIYGYASPAELINSLTDISQKLYVDPGRRAVFVRMMEAHESVSEFESQIYRKDGSIIWISENAHICRNPDGSVYYYEGFVRDITDRKRTEEELSHSEARNRALLNAIPDAIFRISRDGTFLDYKVGKDSIEFTLTNDLLGKTVRQMLPVAIAESVMQHIEQALETGETRVFEYRLPLQSDMRDYEARIVNSGANEVLTIVRDITERKHSDRLKNEFVSIVSHELRTPLTSIRGSLGLIAGGMAGELSDQTRAMLDIAYKNSERLVGLVNDILDIEKIESGKMVFDLKPINLLELVHQALESNRAYGLQYRVEFVLASGFGTTDIKVNVDPDRLLQVFNNLLSNAAKFSPPDSQVEVMVTRRNGTACVSIIDHGCGIPAEFHSRMFQKFVQADSSATRQKAGTGLGLSITRAIVEKLGGHIWFESKVDVGTTFSFELPIWEVVLDTTSAQPRILICEDTPDLAMLLSVVLSHGGFSTDTAYDTSQAKQLLAYNYYDAMTLDILMPGQDGISFIRELRSQEKTRYLPIVVVSALAQQGREQLEGGAFGVVDWLEKPIDQQRLIASIKQAVKQQTGLKSRILHVEDDTDVLQVIALVLKDIADVFQACTLEQARQLLLHETFDLILLDLSLPDGSGMELLTLLNGAQKQSVPVVVFSAHEVSQEVAHKVAAALVKSRTSNQALIDTIKALIQRNWSQRATTP